MNAGYFKFVQNGVNHGDVAESNNPFGIFHKGEVRIASLIDSSISSTGTKDHFRLLIVDRFLKIGYSLAITFLHIGMPVENSNLSGEKTSYPSSCRIKPCKYFVFMYFPGRRNNPHSVAVADVIRKIMK